MRTYIQGHYFASARELEILKNPVNRQILETLKLKYPLGMTANDLKDATKEPIATIYAKLGELEKEYFIKKLTDKRRDKGVRSSFIYIIEEGSTLLQSLFSSQLAPGNVKFSNDIVNIWERISNKEDEERLSNELTQYINKIIRLTKESTDDKIKRIAPDTSKEICCSNCGFNHEAREFIRSVLLHLIDKLEINVGFIRLMKDHELLTDEAYAHLMDLSKSLTIEERSREVSKPTIIQERLPQEHPTPKGVPITIPLRILCIQKDTDSQSVPFLAIDKDARFFSGDADRGIVRDEMIKDTMIKCVTGDLIDDEEYGQEINISINDSIEVINDDLLFPKVSQLRSKIEDIDLARREYVLEAVILDGPYLKEPANDHTPNPYWAMIGDETGVINLEEYGERFLTKLHEGDTIRIIGAWPFTDHLQLNHYGIIEKTGKLSFTSLDKLRQGTRIFPPNKTVTIGQSKVAPNACVKIILHKIHLLNGFTRLSLTIENMNDKKEITFFRKNLRLFQGKKQFECVYYDDRNFRNVKDTIPAGIEETGVLLFEPLGNSQDPVRFHFKFDVENYGNVLFHFDSINISK